LIECTKGTEKMRVTLSQVVAVPNGEGDEKGPEVTTLSQDDAHPLDGSTD
jgi:hypothetical protein